MEKILQRFGMSNSKPVLTLLAQHFKWSGEFSIKTDKEKEETAKVPYSSVVGSIIYLMVCTKPDLAHLVSVMSRYMVIFRKEHWQGVKWIMTFLKGCGWHGLM